MLGVPLSLGIALFITELAPAPAAQLVIYVIDLLAAIPSVVYGLWGLRCSCCRAASPRSTGGSHDAVRRIPVLGTLFGGPVSGRAS